MRTNYNPDLFLLEKDKVYQSSPRLGDKDEVAVLLCIDVEESNVFNTFQILKIIKGLEDYNVGDIVRWRRDWYNYRELPNFKNDYPEYMI